MLMDNIIAYSMLLVSEKCACVFVSAKQGDFTCRSSLWICSVISCISESMIFSSVKAGAENTSSFIGPLHVDNHMLKRIYKKSVLSTFIYIR